MKHRWLVPMAFLTALLAFPASRGVAEEPYVELMTFLREDFEFEAEFLVDSDVGLERRQGHALQRAAKALSRSKGTVSDDVKALKKAASILTGRAFRDDPFYALDVDDVLTEIEIVSLYDRDAYEIIRERTTHPGVLRLLDGYLGRFDKFVDRSLDERDTRKRAAYLFKARRGLDKAVAFFEQFIAPMPEIPANLSGTYSLNLDDFSCVAKHGGTITMQFTEIGNIRVAGEAQLTGWKEYDFFDCFVVDEYDTEMTFTGIRWGDRVLFFFEHEDAWSDYICNAKFSSDRLSGTFERDDFTLVGGALSLNLPAE